MGAVWNSERQTLCMRIFCGQVDAGELSSKRGILPAILSPDWTSHQLPERVTRAFSVIFLTAAIKSLVTYALLGLAAFHGIHDLTYHTGQHAVGDYCLGKGGSATLAIAEDMHVNDECMRACCQG